MQQGRSEGVEEALQRAQRIRARVSGADSAAAADSLAQLARFYDSQGRRADAEPLYRQMLGIRERTAPDSLATAQALNELALAAYTRGQHAESLALFGRALVIIERAKGKDSLEVALVLNSMGLVQEALKQPAEAEPLYLRALAIRDQHDPSGTATAEVLNNLASLQYRQRRFAKAEPLFLRSLGILEQHLGTAHAGLLTALDNLDALYQSTGRRDKAREVAKRAAEIRKSLAQQPAG